MIEVDYLREKEKLKNSPQEVKELVESLKGLIIKEEINEKVKEEIIDDLETIDEKVKFMTKCGL